MFQRALAAAHVMSTEVHPGRALMVAHAKPGCASRQAISTCSAVAGTCLCNKMDDECPQESDSVAGVARLLIRLHMHVIMHIYIM